ncbi:MAG TPA: YCF48-related protein [Solirubrobacteraceae bacterium]|nr:YCF48-related protein [Solirubrobacteraceae bacterium]
MRGNVSTSEDVLDVSFPRSADGFALGAAGGLFRTRDGGQTWRPLDTGSTANPRAVVATSPTTVVLAGPAGLRRSTDAGDTFAAAGRRAVARARIAGLDRAGTTLLAYRARAIFRSADRGRTWRALRRPSRRAVSSRSISSTRGAASGSGPTGGCPHARRRPALDAAARDRHGAGPRHGILERPARLPGHRPLRRRHLALGLPAAYDRRRRHRASAGRRLGADPGRRHRGGPGRTDYLPGGESDLLFSRVGGDAGGAST